MSFTLGLFFYGKAGVIHKTESSSELATCIKVLFYYLHACVYVYVCVCVEWI